MNRYEQGKKVRRVSAVIYLLIMLVIVGGTYIAQQKKGAPEKDPQVQVIPDKNQYVFPDNKVLQE